MNAPFQLPTQLSCASLDDLVGEHDAIERLVDRSGGSAFHRPAWLRAVETGTGQSGGGIVARSGREIVGWLPLTLIRSPLFGRSLVSSGFAVGGGVLARDPATMEKIACEASVLAQRLGCSDVELRGGPVPRGWEAITGRHANFAGPLAEDDDAQLLSIPRKQRAEIRKALRNDLTVTTGRGERERAAHYAVYAASVHALGTPVFPRALFDAALDAFGEDADILTVRRDGEPLASVLSLYHRDTVMPYWGGGVRAARDSRANELMYYALMNHARRRGCARFDFGRSKTGSGAYRFKKNWGFEPEPLTYARWTAPGAKPRNIDPTDAAHGWKIEAWKHLPPFVANRLGPWIARGLG